MRTFSRVHVDEWHHEFVPSFGEFMSSFDEDHLDENTLEVLLDFLYVFNQVTGPCAHVLSTFCCCLRHLKQDITVGNDGRLLIPWALDMLLFFMTPIVGLLMPFVLVCASIGAILHGTSHTRTKLVFHYLWCFACAACAVLLFASYYLALKYFRNELVWEEGKSTLTAVEVFGPLIFSVLFGDLLIDDLLKGQVQYAAARYFMQQLLEAVDLYPVTKNRLCHHCPNDGVARLERVTVLLDRFFMPTKSSVSSPFMRRLSFGISPQKDGFEFFSSSFECSLMTVLRHFAQGSQWTSQPYKHILQKVDKLQSCSVHAPAHRPKYKPSEMLAMILVATVQALLPSFWRLMTYGPAGLPLQFDAPCRALTQVGYMVLSFVVIMASLMQASSARCHLFHVRLKILQLLYLTAPHRHQQYLLWRHPKDFQLMTICMEGEPQISIFDFGNAGDKDIEVGESNQARKLMLELSSFMCEHVIQFPAHNGQCKEGHKWELENKGDKCERCSIHNSECRCELCEQFLCSICYDIGLRESKPAEGSFLDVMKTNLSTLLPFDVTDTQRFAQVRLYFQTVMIKTSMQVQRMVVRITILLFGLVATAGMAIYHVEKVPFGVVVCIYDVIVYSTVILLILHEALMLNHVCVDDTVDMLESWMDRSQNFHSTLLRLTVNADRAVVNNLMEECYRKLHRAVQNVQTKGMPISVRGVHVNRCVRAHVALSACTGASFVLYKILQSQGWLDVLAPHLRVTINGFTSEQG